jgi:Bacterial membrane protein YfhO
LRPHWIELVRCEEFDRRALDLLGVKYAFCRDRSNGPVTLSGWERIGSENGQSLFRRLVYDGGVKLFHRWRVAGSEAPLAARDAALDAAAQGIALVDRDPGASSPNPSAIVGEPEKVEVIEDRPGHMQLQVAAGRSGILMIPDNYDRGWRARVNGTRLKPMRVFHAYLGIPIEPGDSAVALDYDDRFFWIGLSVSCVTGLAIASCLGLAAIRRRSRVT